MRVLLLLLVGLALNQRAEATDSLSCQNAALPAGNSIAVVPLRRDIAPAYFYYRSFDYDYVLVVSQESVISALNKRASTGNKTASALDALIKKDLPLSESTDLFRYVLKDPYYFSLIQWILVDLLARGDAAVMYAPGGDFIAQVTVSRDNGASGASREFRGPYGEILLFALDCIQN
jgi:hypothetical protein